VHSRPSRCDNQSNKQATQEPTKVMTNTHNTRNHHASKIKLKRQARWADKTRKKKQASKGTKKGKWQAWTRQRTHQTTRHCDNQPSRLIKWNEMNVCT
jgi:hypothetical protein